MTCPHNPQVTVASLFWSTTPQLGLGTARQPLFPIHHLYQLCCQIKIKQTNINPSFHLFFRQTSLSQPAPLPSQEALLLRVPKILAPLKHLPNLLKLIVWSIQVVSFLWSTNQSINQRPLFHIGRGLRIARSTPIQVVSFSMINQSINQRSLFTLAEDYELPVQLQFRLYHFYDQPINQLINQSVHQSVSGCIILLISQSINQ